MGNRPSSLEDVVILNPSFWAGRRVLLTGHTGFKGSWLSLWLLSLGAEVWGYALAPEGHQSLFVDLALAQGQLHHHLGDCILFGHRCELLLRPRSLRLAGSMAGRFRRFRFTRVTFPHEAFPKTVISETSHWCLPTHGPWRPKHAAIQNSNLKPLFSKIP